MVRRRSSSDALGSRSTSRPPAASSGSSASDSCCPFLVHVQRRIVGGTGDHHQHPDRARHGQWLHRLRHVHVAHHRGGVELAQEPVLLAVVEQFPRHVPQLVRVGEPQPDPQAPPTRLGAAQTAPQPVQHVVVEQRVEQRRPELFGVRCSVGLHGPHARSGAHLQHQELQPLRRHRRSERHHTCLAVRGIDDHRVECVTAALDEHVEVVVKEGPHERLPRMCRVFPGAEYGRGR